MVAAFGVGARPGNVELPGPLGWRGVARVVDPQPSHGLPCVGQKVSPLGELHSVALRHIGRPPVPRHGGHGAGSVPLRRSWRAAVSWSWRYSTANHALAPPVIHGMVRYASLENPTVLSR